MTSIKNILSLLDNELQNLVSSYENQIIELKNLNQTKDDQLEELKNENKKLNSKVDSLISENRQLQEQLSLLQSNEAIIDSSTPTNPYHEMIDELFLSSTLEDSIRLLEYCHQFIDLGQMEKLHYILELFIHKPNPLLHMDPRIPKLLERIFNKLIVARGRRFDDSLEKVIGSFLDLISRLHNTHLKDQMNKYLLEQYSEILDMVLYTNVPRTIILFLRLLMKFELFTELKESLSHVIRSEWEFLDYHISKEEFCFFIWYAFFVDLDQQLLDKAEESLKWLNEKQTEMDLYFFMYDCINAEKIVDNQKLKQLTYSFREGDILTEQECTLILKKVNNALNTFMYDSVAIPIFTGNLYKVTPEVLQALIERFQLQKKKMLVPLLKSKGVNITSKYIQLSIFYKSDKKAFISEDTVGMVNQKYEPRVLQTKIYDKIVNLVRNVAKDQSSDSFQWPSTEVKLKQNTDSHDQPTLNENSELKMVGYQITGMTRAKRWSILEKAVPTLGLKKVAYIIASNIRLRKGQKNGRTKYNHAITEWEYDLDKLKKIYYKNDFIWPRV